MFLELVDFSRSEAVRVVKILSDFKTESEAGYSKVVVEKVREYIEYYTASVSCNLIGQYCTSKLLFSMEAHIFSRGHLLFRGNGNQSLYTFK